MLRLRIDRAVRGRRLAGAFLLALLMGGGGCGGGGGDDGGTDPVPCSITNVSTGTQSSWLAGLDGPANLRWDHQGTAANVKIELLKAGAVVAVVSASTENDGFYPWTPSTGGQPDGSDFGLRVTALGETGCAGEKNGLTLTDVSGCTLTWVTPPPALVAAGDAVTLEWTGASTSGTLTLELWNDDLGGLPQLIGVVAVDTPDDGLYVWDPADSFHAGSSEFYQLRLLDSRVAGCEAMSGFFRLDDTELCACRVSGFSAGAVFTEGQTVSLNLDQDFGSGLVDLRLMVGSEPIVGGTIANDVPVDQVYNWVVNDYNYAGLERSRFRIKAIDAADGYCVGQSDLFSIQ